MGFTRFTVFAALILCLLVAGGLVLFFYGGEARQRQTATPEADAKPEGGAESLDPNIYHVPGAPDIENISALTAAQL